VSQAYVMEGWAGEAGVASGLRSRSSSGSHDDPEMFSVLLCAYDVQLGGGWNLLSVGLLGPTLRMWGAS